MAEIGKVTPSAPIVTRVPRDRTATDEQNHPPQQGDEKEKQGHDEDENNKSEQDGGIDLYV